MKKNKVLRINIFLLLFSKCLHEMMRDQAWEKREGGDLGG